VAESVLVLLCHIFGGFAPKRLHWLQFSSFLRQEYLLFIEWCGEMCQPPHLHKPLILNWGDRLLYPGCARAVRPDHARAPGRVLPYALAADVQQSGPSLLCGGTSSQSYLILRSHQFSQSRRREQTESILVLLCGVHGRWNWCDNYYQSGAGLLLTLLWLHNLFDLRCEQTGRYAQIRKVRHTTAKIRGRSLEQDRRHILVGGQRQEQQWTVVETG